MNLVFKIRGRESSIVGVDAAPSTSQHPRERWGAKHPTFSRGIWGRKGRSDPPIPGFPHRPAPDLKIESGRCLGCCDCRYCLTWASSIFCRCTLLLEPLFGVVLVSMASLSSSSSSSSSSSCSVSFFSVVAVVVVVVVVVVRRRRCRRRCRRRRRRRRSSRPS